MPQGRSIKLSGTAEDRFCAVATRIWRGLPYNFAQKISCFHNDLAGKCGQGLGMCHICQTRLSPICCKKSRVRDTHIQSGEGHKNGINSTTSGHPRASHRSATNDSRATLRGRPTCEPLQAALAVLFLHSPPGLLRLSVKDLCSNSSNMRMAGSCQLFTTAGFRRGEFRRHETCLILAVLNKL